ncbi:MAG: DUF2012 domain-containing protein, partial [Pseudomonadota bacterium]
MRFRFLTGGAIAALTACLATPALAGEVRGTVSDASDVDTLRAAEIRIVELGRRTTTARDGTFVFNDVPEGSYTIVASYIGAPTVEYTIAVPAEGTVTRNFILG